jgi:hypothetical protein
MSVGCTIISWSNDKGFFRSKSVRNQQIRRINHAQAGKGDRSGFRFFN